MKTPRQYDCFPEQRPNTPLLDQAPIPAKLRELSENQLPQLADELREDLLYRVGQSGGHFGAGLGVVELTVALHYLLDTPRDKLVWDVGHQTYPHKILTGRRDSMHSIRQADGLSGFPKRKESEYDTFGVGHSSTSISAALGMALAHKDDLPPRQTVAVIGDGAMTAGMAFEALNHAADTGANMLVILNDNMMSISKNTGGLATYFAKIWASKTYMQLREGSKKVLAKIPPASEFARRTEEHMKGMVAPGTLFEELGFNYIGPLDGHDLSSLVPTIRNMLLMKGPRLLHITTTKGKGFAPAEADPVGYHAVNKIEKQVPQEPVLTALDANADQASINAVADQGKAKTKAKLKYQDVFGQWLCDMAAVDNDLIAITPAMCEGSGMVDFAQQYPTRYHDVAIAEQHAVTLAAGLAAEGKKPVVAIYSTFLQRAYDQLVHDVALQNLDVTFGIDRAGLVGEDGPTHAGSFDLSFLRCIPNMIVMTPSDENETRQLLYTGFQFPGPAAIRYPRGTGPGAEIQQTMEALPMGKGVLRRQGKRVAILNFGTLLPAALAVADKLDFSVADMRFVKPIDEALIDSLAANHDLIVSLEENAIQGGAGSAVSEYLNQSACVMPVLHLGLPDRFVDHGKHPELLAQCGLDQNGIEAAINERLKSLFANSANAPQPRLTTTHI